MSAPGAPPERSSAEDAAPSGRGFSTPPPGGVEDAARAAAGAITASIIEILRALREEIERLRHGTEQFVGRVKGALVRSLAALQRAIVATLLAGIFFVLGAIVLSIFLVAVLNRYLGDPWGTGLAALLLIAAAALFSLRTRAAFRAMEREAAALRRGPL